MEYLTFSGVIAMWELDQFEDELIMELPMSDLELIDIQASLNVHNRHIPWVIPVYPVEYLPFDEIITLH
jgi:hypothetical protein